MPRFAGMAAIACRVSILRDPRNRKSAVADFDFVSIALAAAPAIRHGCSEQDHTGRC
jgi:hypothetical protein